MTIEEVLELLDQMSRMLAGTAVLVSGDDEIRNLAGAELCSQLAATIRGEGDERL